MKIILKIIDSLFLFRLLLLIPVWTVLILGWITGNVHASLGGIATQNYIESDLWVSLIFFSLIVSSIYIVNQIADVESDRLNNKLFILPRGLVTITEAWMLAVCCAGIGLVGAFVFFDVNMGVLFLL